MKKKQVKGTLHEDDVRNQLKNVSNALVYLCNNLTDEASKGAETEDDEFICALSLYRRIDYYIGMLNVISDKVISVLEQESLND